MKNLNSAAARSAILAKANAHRFNGNLLHPTRTARARNTSCGDEIAVEIEIANERILNVAADVRACLVTEAAWTIAAEAILGLTLAQAETEIRNTLFSLENQAEPIGEKWKLLESYCRPHPRLRCATLPLEALLRSLNPYVEN